MINSVKKALNILSLLGVADSPMTVTAISAEIGINRSTCSHIIATLVESGYAERVTYKSGYILGPEAYFIASSKKYRESLITVCKPVIGWLYQKIQSPVSLVTIKADQKFFLLTMNIEDGEMKLDRSIRKDDGYGTPTARAILANMSREEALKVYERFGNPPPDVWNEVTSKETFLTELAKIDPKGVIITRYFDTKRNVIVVGFGAAIFKGAICIGSIGAALFCEPGKDYSSEFTNIKRNVGKAAREITKRLTSSGLTMECLL